ncbi:MAG: glutamate-cysteine ligase family protein [Atopobiaceae bacterium]
MSDGEDKLDTYARNHSEMLSVLMSGERFGTHGDGRRCITISLERFVYNMRAKHTVSYEGEGGVRELLEHMRQFFPTHSAQMIDGCLVGFTGTVETSGHEQVDVDISLGAGAQLIVKVGPSSSVAHLLEAIEVHDRQVHIAAQEMGREYSLLAEGYNPTVSGPIDVPLVPEMRFTLLSAHLAKTGRLGKDAMRCLGSLRVAVEYGDEIDALKTYRLAVALSPLAYFLTDNTRSFRGQDALHTPRMQRSRIMEETDSARTGIIAGTFGAHFSFEAYVSWLESLKAIYFVDSMGATAQAGDKTIHQLLQERALSGSELMHLFDMAKPDVKLQGVVQLDQADALRPRYAAAWAAFLKGIFYSDDSFIAAQELIGQVGEKNVRDALLALRQYGWNADVYGRPVTELVEKLVRLARAGLEQAEEQAILDELTSLWEVRMVPADAFTAHVRPATSIRDYLGI